MLKTLVTRSLGAVCATGLALGLAAVGGTAHAQTVHPASSLDGTITFSDVLKRENDWTKHHFAYSQSTYQTDLDHDHKYRLDCSGYSDMALHLGSDFNTDAFAHHADENMAFTWNKAVKTGTPSTINPTNVHTGDLFDDTSDGHMFIFGKWTSSTAFTYYSFGTGYTDTDAYKTGHPTNNELGGWPRSHYRVIRYKRVVSG